MNNVVEIAASPKQLSKLRNGHAVRIKPPPPQGKGVFVILHPENYSRINRTFSRNKGLQVRLSPEEILANQEASSQMSGQGIFGKTFDRSVRKLVGKPAQKAIYGAARSLLPVAQAGLTAGLTSAGTALGVAQPELIPFIPAGIAGLSALGSDYLANPSAYQSNVGGSRAKLAGNLAGRMLQDRALQEINNATGANLGALDRASIENALSNKAQAELNKLAVQAKQQSLNSVEGQGLYAGGKGLGLGVGGRRMTEKRRSGGSVGIHGSLIQGVDHPARRSQPFGTHFQFQHFLPPQYQKFSKGTGLYL